MYFLVPPCFVASEPLYGFCLEELEEYLAPSTPPGYLGKTGAQGRYAPPPASSCSFDWSDQFYANKLSEPLK